MSTPPSGLRIRPYRAQDAAATLEIFVRAILTAARTDYTEEQTTAWLGDHPRATGWNEERQHAGTFVAELDGIVAGFSDLRDDGYIDRLFTFPGLARRGIGGALVQHAIARGRDRALAALSTHASRLARPVFERAGFQVQERQLVRRGDVELERFAMRLPLDTAGTA
jgi:putative acetyltransferase